MPRNFIASFMAIVMAFSPVFSPVSIAYAADGGASENASTSQVKNAAEITDIANADISVGEDTAAENAETRATPLMGESLLSPRPRTLPQTLLFLSRSSISISHIPRSLREMIRLLHSQPSMTPMQSNRRFWNTNRLPARP